MDWLEIVKNNSKWRQINNKRIFGVNSWHIARDLNLKTSKVNYELTKLVKAGKLIKESCAYCTIYALAEIK